MERAEKAAGLPTPIGGPSTQKDNERQLWSYDFIFGDKAAVDVALDSAQEPLPLRSRYREDWRQGLWVPKIQERL